MVRGRGGGRAGPLSFPSLCPLRSFLCPFLICTPLTSSAPSSPIVPFCAARCRLGEDRLPKGTPRRVRSQGAGVRATQCSAGAFIDSNGTGGQSGGRRAHLPDFGCVSKYPDCRPARLASTPNSPSMHTQWKAEQIWAFHAASFLPGGLGAPSFFLIPPKPWSLEHPVATGISRLCLRLQDNPIRRGSELLAPFPVESWVTYTEATRGLWGG